MARMRGLLSGFEAGYGIADRMIRDYEEGVVKRDIRQGLESAKKDAAEGSKTTYQLDKGGDDKGLADYQSKSKADIDMIAKQEDDIRALQADTATGGAQTSALQEVAAPRGTPLPAQNGLETLTQKPAMSAPGGNMSEVPAAGTTAPAYPAEQAAAPKAAEAGYTRSEIKGPQRAAMDIFHKQYAPQVITRLMEQGKIKEAKAFEDWSTSEKGASYGRTWLDAVRREKMGDSKGAMASMEKLYNEQLPDGQYATTVENEDGTFKVQVRSEGDNKLVDEFAGKGPDLAQALLGMGSPDKVWSYMQGLESAATARAEKKEDAATKFEQDKELERIKGENRPESMSPMEKALNAVKKARERGASAQEIADLEAYAEKVKTRGEGGGVTLQFGAIDPDTGKMPVRNPKTGSVELRDVEGAATNIDKAKNLLSGVQVGPNRSGRGEAYYLGGKRLAPDDPRVKEITKAQTLLQQYKEPFELKRAAPGL